jgi:hypothetical protein
MTFQDIAKTISPKGLPAMGALMIAGLSAIVSAQSPALGWFKAGAAPGDYETGVDTQVSMSGAPSGFLRNLVARPSGYGSLVHEVSAADYQGKRIRLSSFVKTQDVTDWAVLWMRIDAGRRVLTIDTMMNRAIRGTTDWTRYDILLDVDQTATRVGLGAMLSGSGEIWLSGVKLEIVTSDVPVTSTSGRTWGAPRNLGFEEDPK